MLYIILAWNCYFESFSFQELLKEAEACRSKRKCDSISAVPTAATTSSSTDWVGLRRAKKQKIDKKEYNCTLCQITVKGDNVWLCHLNGKRHRNTLNRLGSKVQINKKANSNMVVKSTSRIGLAAVKVEMDNADSLAAMPTAEERIVKKMQVCGISTTCSIKEKERPAENCHILLIF